MPAESQPGFRDIPDEVVEAFVAEHPDGASSEQIAEAIGMSRQRVHQLVSKALVKALRGAEKKGLMCPSFYEPQSHWDKF